MPPLSDPRYMEALKTLVGKKISSSTMKTVQAAHDSAHQMHDHTTALGAACNGMRLLKTNDCPTCEGTGQISKDGKQEDCTACGGSGTPKTLAEKNAQDAADRAADDKRNLNLKTAGCGCHKGAEMTKEQRADTIKTLVANKHSGFVAGDEPLLEAASDDRLASFVTAAESREKEVKDQKAEPKALTTEEVMAVAPPELKSLLKRLEKQEGERKTNLVAALKTAQDEYGEAELSTMKLEELERMARVAKVEERPSYEGRGVPRAAMQNEDIYANPPSPYSEEALKAHKAGLAQ